MLCTVQVPGHDPVRLQGQVSDCLEVDQGRHRQLRDPPGEAY